MSDFKINLIGSKGNGFLSVPDIVEFYRLRTDAAGRFSQQVVWDKSIDYYEPDFDFAEYNFKSCNGGTLLSDCRINRHSNSGGNLSIAIVVKRR